MTTFERIKELSTKQGKSLQRVSEELGFGVNYLYQLKNQQPTAEKLTLIADYFNVSVDYLLGRIDQPTPLMAYDATLEKLLSQNGIQKNSDLGLTREQFLYLSSLGMANLVELVGNDQAEEISKNMRDEKADNKFEQEYPFKNFLIALNTVMFNPIEYLMIYYGLLTKDNQKKATEILQKLVIAQKHNDEDIFIKREKFDLF